MVNDDELMCWKTPKENQKAFANIVKDELAKVDRVEKYQQILKGEDKKFQKQLDEYRELLKSSVTNTNNEVERFLKTKVDLSVEICDFYGSYIRVFNSVSKELFKDILC